MKPSNEILSSLPIVHHFSSPNLRFPNGSKAEGTDRIMLQSIWAKHLHREGYSIISANVGHPTLNVTLPACKASYDYWNGRFVALTKGSKLLQASEAAPDVKRNKEDIRLKAEQYVKLLNQMYPSDSAGAKKIMAEALNNYYHVSAITKGTFAIRPENIAFCIGGAAGMHAIFGYLTSKFPYSAILTPFPHYTLYSQYGNTLLPLHMNPENGFRFCASDLIKELAKAKSSGTKISALLLCNPNNPLGTILSEDEWKAIIHIIKDENFYIVLDEAYIEMGDFSKKKSLPFLPFILSELNSQALQPNSDANRKQYLDIIRRTMIMRSATKALSAAGERMATVVIFDSSAMQHIQDQIDIVSPPPYSSTFAYAQAIHFIADPQNWQQLSLLQEYYKVQVEYVSNRLKQIGLGLPANYVVQGTFYVIANFDFLIGYQIKDEALLKRLNDIGLGLDKDNLIRTDVQIGYFLLSQYGISITPLSYFSADPTKGYLRITCSAGKEFLDTLLCKIETVYHLMKPHDFSVVSHSSKIVNKQNEVTTSLAKLIKTAALASKQDQKYEAQNLQFQTVANKLSSHHHYLPANKIHFKFQNIVRCAEEFCKQITQYWQEMLSKTSHVEAMKEDLFKSSYTLTLRQLKFILMIASNNILNYADGLPCDKSLSKNDYETYITALSVYFQSKNDNQPASSTTELEVVERAKFIGEKIMSDISQHSTPGKIFKQLFERNLNDACRDFIFINKVVKEAAAIDYGHPDGDEENRLVVAHLIQYVFELSKISKDNVLFLGCNALALMKHVCHGDIISMEAFEKQHSSPASSLSPKKVVAIKVSYGECKNYSSKELNDLCSAIQNENLYVILEDFLLDFTDETRSANLLHLVNALPENKIIFIQSSSIFSSEKEKIYFLVTQDNNLKSLLVMQSINFHVHSTRSLQFGFAKALQQLITVSNAENVSQQALLTLCPQTISSQTEDQSSHDTYVSSPSTSPTQSACSTPSSSGASTPRMHTPIGFSLNSPEKLKQVKSVPVSPVKPSSIHDRLKQIKSVPVSPVRPPFTPSGDRKTLMDSKPGSAGRLGGTNVGSAFNSPARNLFNANAPKPVQTSSHPLLVSVLEPDNLAKAQKKPSTTG